ncbi:hypothetical protein SS50377_20846 [Spironucleus salmonicida]|uniref:Uncharacterized protein n=1 Tax=Spironucleus salmonicida TaxID=348837 RepID=V6LRW6_9EUKA|nr:hypothetical protein SS50377_20829 [Spironucleus salmonicida]KAH0577492.1 hypothetical protein SS50377_20846 [Spironucleus salmonicida]|eukprot:EST43524.1 Hypothetical protein SS50377_16559 [Spironucleus salmonicida]
MFREVFFATGVFAPAQLFEIGTLDIQARGRLTGVLANVPHQILPSFLFRKTAVAEALFTYERITFGQLKPIHEQPFPALPAQSDFPAALDRETSICRNRNPFGIPVLSLEHFKKVPRQEVTVIVDFELYYQTKAAFYISEIGAVRVSGASMETFRRFVAPPPDTANASARYISKVITGIPCQKHKSIAYVSQGAALAELVSFIGAQKIIFAKGRKLEQQILPTMQVEEVYPYFCQQRGFAIPAMAGTRCAFHARVPQRFHCALEDVTEWGKLFL